jgi:hypothetical protein
MPRPAFGSDSNRFMRPDRYCAWSGCNDSAFTGLPVCFSHAIIIADVVEASMPPEPGVQSRKSKSLSSWVYYLMIGPSTVKIGVTTNLPRRLAELRTDVQYVVAIEQGGRDRESQRHKQFADERFGRREDFRLSDQLKRHIEGLQPDRDEMITTAFASVRFRNTLI